MWVVLACYLGCGMGFCPVENARAHDWSAELALKGIPARLGCDVPGFGTMEGFPGDLTEWRANGFNSDRFLTQHDCLRELRRLFPEVNDREEYPDGTWEQQTVTHHRYHVETYEGVGPMGMNRSELYACFQEAPLVG